MKRLFTLFVCFAMLLALAVPAFALDANEQNTIEIEVTKEQDILDFIFSDGFDPHVAYSFVYPDTPVMTRALCSNCGYNSLVGKQVEDFDLCHPSSQGRTVQCPEMVQAPDSFYVLLTYVYQYCNTCGYKSAKTFSESKYYIGCAFDETNYVATNYKTRNRIGVSHEWKDTWSVYYSDPHA